MYTTTKPPNFFWVQISPSCFAKFLQNTRRTCRVYMQTLLYSASWGFCGHCASPWLISIIDYISESACRCSGNSFWFELLYELRSVANSVEVALKRQLKREMRTRHRVKGSQPCGLHMFEPKKMECTHTYLNKCSYINLTNYPGSSSGGH